MYKLDTNLLEQKLRNQIPNIENKKVVVRTCLNVITDPQGNMTDKTRYDESLPFIKYLSENAKAVLVTAHLGRPKNNEPEFSFANIAKTLENDLGKKVNFISNLDELKTIETGVYFLENVRFFAGEDAKDAQERKAFAQKLSDGFDIFVNDAFADYRESASTYDIATLLPSYVGPVFAKEISELNKLRTSEKPLVALIGGSKLSEKLDALFSLLEISDKVLVGGAMRYTLFKAMGINIGNSRVEEDKVEIAKEILQKYKDKIVLPEDHMIINEFKNPAIIGYSYTEDQSIPDGYEAIDIGPKGIKLFADTIAQAKTIVWNGPMGVFEWAISAHGTNEIGKAIAQNTSAYKLIGGGDSIAAVNSLGLTGFNHICTGGGAMLAYVAYEKFPTLDIVLGV